MSETIISKRCSKCKGIKPLYEFTKCRTTKDGLQYKCKSCARNYNQTEEIKAQQRAYRKTEKGKALSRIACNKYQKTTKGKAAEKRYRQSDKGKARTERYRKSEKRKATKKQYDILHPEYKKAGDAINHAIRDGKLPRANTLQCHYCPNQAKQYHHYKGYEPEHWFDVVPVCIPCHHNQEVLASRQLYEPLSSSYCSL